MIAGAPFPTWSGLHDRRPFDDRRLPWPGAAHQLPDGRRLRRRADLH